MKVIVDRPALHDALSIVGRAAATKTPREAFTCIKVTAPKGGPMHLSAQDGDVSIAMTLPGVDVQDPETKGILIPASKLLQVIHCESSPTVTIESDGDVANIRSNDAAYKIFLVTAEWPGVAEIGDATTFKIAPDMLARILASLRPMCATENSRYAIAGMLFRFSKDATQIAATDGRRLGLVERPEKAAGVSSHPKSFLVSPRGVAMMEHLCKLGSGDDRMVTMRFGGTLLDASFHEGPVGLARINMTLIDGAFPPFEDVIPKDLDVEAVVGREAFIDALSLASLMTQEETKGVRLDLAGGTCYLRSQAAEVGAAIVRFALSSPMKGTAGIAMNPRFLIDAMRHAESPTMTLSFKAGTSNKPCMVTGDIAKHVIMPVTMDMPAITEADAAGMRV